MNFILKMINGDREVLSEEEYATLMNTGYVGLKRNGHYINQKSVSNAYPESDEEEVTGGRKDSQKIGVLHDGTRAIKQFGEWFALDGQRNAKGYFETRLDPTYYPEAAKDCMPDPEEYEAKYAALPPEERLTKMLGGTDVKRIGEKKEFVKLMG